MAGFIAGDSLALLPHVVAKCARWPPDRRSCARHLALDRSRAPAGDDRGVPQDSTASLGKAIIRSRTQRRVKEASFLNSCDAERRSVDAPGAFDAPKRVREWRVGVRPKNKKLALVSQLDDALYVRVPRPRRELVENCRILRVRQLLDRFGPLVLDPETQTFMCRASQKFNFVFDRSIPRFGAVRWWLLCQICRGRCAKLYSPRSVNPPKLRCRRCWGLCYRSQLV